MDHVDSFLYRPLYFMLNLFLFPSTIYTYEKLARRKSCYVSCLGWIKQKLQVSQNRPIKTKECVFKKTCDPTIPLCLAQFELVVLSFFFSPFQCWKCRLSSCFQPPWRRAAIKGWVRWVSPPKMYATLFTPKLVGGWPTPLNNDGVRQLGWWHSQYMEKRHSQTTN